jgi:hypothetical protein
VGQGYKRVGFCAALNSGQSVLEIAGSFAALALLPQPQRTGPLATLGAVSLACALLSAVVGERFRCLLLGRPCACLLECIS